MGVENKTEFIEVVVWCPKCKQNQPGRKWGVNYSCNVCGAFIAGDLLAETMFDRRFSSADFNALKAEFYEAEDRILGLKEIDYAEDDDRLANFHQQADLQGVEPMDIALTYMLKHVLSVAKIVRTRNFNWTWQTEVGTEGDKQRFADMRNYALLLAACIYEYMERKPSAEVNKNHDYNSI